jgi:hypothetical protein
MFSPRGAGYILLARPLEGHAKNDVRIVLIFRAILSSAVPNLRQHFKITSIAGLYVRLQRLMLIELTGLIWEIVFKIRQDISRGNLPVL